MQAHPSASATAAAPVSSSPFRSSRISCGRCGRAGDIGHLELSPKILGTAKQATKKAAAPLELVAASIPAGNRLNIAGSRARFACHLRLLSRSAARGCPARHFRLTARGDAGEHNLCILETVLTHHRVKDAGILRRYAYAAMRY